MKILETDRLLLRELKPEDSVMLHEILGDRETMAFYPTPYNPEAVKDWIKRSIKSYQTNGFGLWAVILKTSNQFIGQCGISLQDIDGQLVPEIGYHISKQHWNQCYATEAAMACLTYGFEKLTLESIYIHTYIKNLPSQRVAEKLGMKRLKEYDKQLKHHGLIWKHIVYSITSKSHLSGNR